MYEKMLIHVYEVATQPWICIIHVHVCHNNYSIIIKGFAVDNLFNTTLTFIIIATTNYNDQR